MEGQKAYNYTMFKCFTRKFKCNEAEPPPDVRDAFAEFAGASAASVAPEGVEYDVIHRHMSAEQLLLFLVDYQCEERSSLTAAQGIIADVIHRRHCTTRLARHGLSLEDFHHYLFSVDFNPPIRSQVHHDMAAPLQHYFIYTGHNSYLTGNQLSSDCSDAPIIKALQRGVRVIELDLWPNSAKDGVQVYHGRTITTPVTLIKCLKSIKEYAFVASPYPVVITLEDHLTPDLQAKVAEMVIQTFGEMLYYPESDFLENFPSPEALKHRIVLSTKLPKEYLRVKNPKDKGSVSPNGGESCEATVNQENLPQDTKYKGNASPNGRESFEVVRKDTLEHFLAGDMYADDQTDSDQDDEENDAVDHKSDQLGTLEYKRLIGIHAGKPKGGLKEALRIGLDNVRRLSLSEQGLERAATYYGTDVVRFTQKNILRIYPKGTRFNSSNYKPLVGWIHGAQMVAFNMQGYGKFLWVMQGMFRSNGGCGYVQKPAFLMKRGPHGEVFNPKVAMPTKSTLKVKVYMGDGWSLDFSPTHFDTYSPPDFYTKVHIVGVPQDCAKEKTKVIEDNWVPVWDEEFSFSLSIPELALLRVEVREYDRSEKDDFGGQTCLLVSELRPGIRAVPLFDKKGDRLRHARLLMRFQFV